MRERGSSAAHILVARITNVVSVGRKELGDYELIELERRNAREMRQGVIIAQRSKIMTVSICLIVTIWTCKGKGIIMAE